MWLFALLLPVSNVLAADKNVAGPWWGSVVRQLPCQAGVKLAADVINFTLTPITFPRAPQDLQMIDFTSQIGIVIEDRGHMTVTFDAYRNNRWIENAIAPFKFKRGACTKWRLLVPDLFVKVFKMSAEYRKPCVIETGHYEVHNTAINWSVPSLPYFFYGHYRMHFVAGYEKEELLCAGIEFKIFPK